MFPKINLKIWDSNVSTQGLDLFMTEQTRGKHVYRWDALNNRNETEKTKKMNERFLQFHHEWELLFDGSLLRYF